MRRLAIGASAVLALSVVLLPWYALDSYMPSGWDATWWARAAVGAALVNIVALQARRQRIAASAALIAAVAVLVRVVAPPDFGFGFGGVLTVPVGRQAGLWVALAASLLALLASALLASRQARPSSPEPAAPSPPPAPSSAA